MNSWPPWGTALIFLVSGPGVGACQVPTVPPLVEGAETTDWQDVSTVDERSPPPDISAPDGLYGLPLISVTGRAPDLDRMHELTDEEITILVSVEVGDRTWHGVKMELHGGFARSAPKKTYRFTFPDEDWWETDVLGQETTLRRAVLQAAWIDPTFIRNKLTLDAIRDLGGLAPRVGFATVEINGAWQGLYSVIERIDKPYLGRNGLAKDGNLYKAESHWANWAHKDDPLAGYDIQSGQDNDHADLGEMLEALATTRATYEDFREDIESILSLDDFMVFQVVHTLAMNQDTFTKNYYLHHDPFAREDDRLADRRFRIISWDADATWAINWDGEVLPSDQTDWYGSDAFSPRLFSIPTYRQTYEDLYRDALAGPLAPEAFALRVGSLASLLKPAADADQERWDREVGFEDAIEALKAAIAHRHEVMTEVLDI